MDLSFNNFTQKICSVQTDITKELLYQLENMKLYKDKSQLNNYDKTSLFDRVVYDQVFNFLNEYIVPIINKYGYEKFKLINCWNQRYYKNDYHSLHTHNNGKNNFSCILYVKCKEKSSATRFYPPGYPYIVFNEFIDIYPKVGKLVVFPGYLPHEVLPNKDDERLIMSENIEVE